MHLLHIHTFLFRTRFFCHFSVCPFVCKTALFVLSVGCSFLAKITGFIFGQIGFYRTQYTNTVHCCCCSQIMTKMSQNLAQILFVHKNSVTIFISLFHAWTKPLLCTRKTSKMKMVTHACTMSSLTTLNVPVLMITPFLVAF